MNQITSKTIDLFEQHLKYEEKAPVTISKYINDIRTFKEWLNGRLLSKELVLEYKKELLTHYAPTSTNSILSSLNSFFSFYKCYELKTKTIKIQRQLFSLKEKELSRNDYERLLLAAKAQNNDQLFYLMQTIASTGIRVSELCFITVKAVNKKEAEIYCKGKFRLIILPNSLCKMLKYYIKKHHIKSGPIFVTKTGAPLHRSNIWKMMRSLCSFAGVAKEKVFPHNLRHLFARIFYSMQKDIVRLADILGHSNINTTRIYTMESPNIHRQQLERLNFIYMPT